MIMGYRKILTALLLDCLIIMKDWWSALKALRITSTGKQTASFIFESQNNPGQTYHDGLLVNGKGHDHLI